MLNDDLGMRMKTYYEDVAKTKLMRRVPVVIRLDGKAFHTFTKGMIKPFDPILSRTMEDTMEYLCTHIQNCVFGYTQSDEITLILIDYQTLETSAWFDYEVQKMCSVSAAMATLAFNIWYKANVQTTLSPDVDARVYASKYNSALFDSRCFNIPREEVTNLLYWRQLDAMRNSIQALGQAHFSSKQLNHKSCEDIKTMLKEKYDIDWEKLDTNLKRGCCYYKIADTSLCEGWIEDNDIPVFKGEGRDYVEKCLLK